MELLYLPFHCSSPGFLWAEKGTRRNKEHSGKNFFFHLCHEIVYLHLALLVEGYTQFNNDPVNPGGRVTVPLP